MKDNYDFSSMKRIPHPLLGKRKLISNIGQLSDDEFENKLQGLEPDERDIAIMLRKRRRSNNTENSNELKVSEKITAYNP